ncbi:MULTISPECIES: nucleoside permease [Serratia]|uniref:nucleoside permease n=1 Tax=Serratia TaxID=613 RepID=UPI000742EB51|nr:MULTISPECIES: nucleoside permease [Serratia]ALX96820.1 nucleoside permease [Serratia fonticola]PAA95405.1 MFS transporter [Serratia fonticola]QXN64693.1 nucleoside permease [Serratia fonticola]UAN56764.1 nucleoside permease [Serratia sp. JSRIV004]CAI0757844.1 Xanthosine transporter [Serratia fonticola]
MAIKTRLKVMIFLQFFIWGAWLVTLGSYMINTLHFSGAQVGMVYSSKGIAALIMPSLAGIIADRWIKANRLYGLCHLLGAVALYYAAQVDQPMVMFWVMLFNAMVYMPTMALSNAISYFCLEKHGFDTVKDFPPVRVYGTVGFILAMWLISFSRIELSNMQLYLASAVSLLLAVYSLTLPNCPTNKVKRSQSWVSLLGLDAFVLFKQKRMAVFFLFAMLLGAALQITNTFGNPFLHDFSLNPLYQDSLSVRYPSVLLSLSQISEVFFILTIPFFLRRYGIKQVMLISMAAWTLRFLFLAYGTPAGFGFLLLLLSMIVYGCAFDFFNISGAIFVEKETDHRIRASAQGLFMTMVNGAGAYVGAIASGEVVDFFTHNGVKDWQSIWLVFAAYTLVLGVIFALSFNYQHRPEEMNGELQKAH